MAAAHNGRGETFASGVTPIGERDHVNFTAQCRWRSFRRLISRESSTLAATWWRAPMGEDLVRDYVLEEMAVREARALDIDWVGSVICWSWSMSRGASCMK
jgi:hypothetical protein